MLVSGSIPPHLQLNSSLEQQPILHFSKMGFPAEGDPRSCTHATMWFLVPEMGL